VGGALRSARAVHVAAPVAARSLEFAAGIAGVAHAAVGLEEAALAGAAARARTVADARLAIVLTAGWAAGGVAAR
jgi:hypothetical protein